MGSLKSLLVFVSPKKSFFGLFGALTKIQIDNSLNLGYSPNDITLVTNFPWEYNSVKAITVNDSHYCAVRPRSIKTSIIPFLIEEGILEKQKTYWNHDLDAFELNKIDESKLELDGFDAGLTDYGWKPRWCLGSFFIKTSAKDIFEKTKPLIYSNIEDESALMQVTQEPQINNRCKRLNITYNFGMRHIAFNYRRAHKPLQVLHFQPYSSRMPTMDMFLYGKNELNMPLANTRLKKIFRYHRIT